VQLVRAGLGQFKTMLTTVKGRVEYDTKVTNCVRWMYKISKQIKTSDGDHVRFPRGAQPGEVRLFWV